MAGSERTPVVQTLPVEKSKVLPGEPRPRPSSKQNHSAVSSLKVAFYSHNSRNKWRKNSLLKMIKTITPKVSAVKTYRGLGGNPN